MLVLPSLIVLIMLALHDWKEREIPVELLIALVAVALAHYGDVIHILCRGEVALIIAIGALLLLGMGDGDVFTYVLVSIFHPNIYLNLLVYWAILQYPFNIYYRLTGQKKYVPALVPFVPAYLLALYLPIF
jgi:Flp pilus assembly protein protease CpaA